MKQSELSPYLWLVKFFDAQVTHSYCSESMLHFEEDESIHSHTLKADGENMLAIEKVDNKVDKDHEVVLKKPLSKNCSITRSRRNHI